MKRIIIIFVTLFLTWTLGICQTNQFEVFVQPPAEGSAAIAGFADNDQLSRTYGVIGSSNSIDGIGVFGTGRTGMYAQGWDFGLFAVAPQAGFFIGNVKVEGNSVFDGNIEVKGTSEFKGNIMYSGTLMGPMSDRRLKRFVKQNGTFLDLVDQLKVKKYFYKSEVFERLSLSDRIQYGLVAQELEKIMPELVFEIPVSEIKNNQSVEMKSENYKTINYMGLIPVALGSIKELSKQISSDRLTIERQHNKIEDLSRQIEKLSRQVESLLK